MILSLSEYEELLEDLKDLAVIAERREEDGIHWDEVKKKLRKDGVLTD